MAAGKKTGKVPSVPKDARDWQVGDIAQHVVHNLAPRPVAEVDPGGLNIKLRAGSGTTGWLNGADYVHVPASVVGGLVDPIVRFTHPPTCTWRSPICGGCAAETLEEKQGWQCPLCGTVWPYDQLEGERGLSCQEASAGTDVSYLPLVEAGPDSWVEVARIQHASSK